MGQCCLARNNEAIKGNQQNIIQPYVPLAEGEQFSSKYMTIEGDFIMQVEKGGIIQKDYKLQEPALGKGAFGEVRKAQHKQTGAMRAVKIINKSQVDPFEQEQLVNEVNILLKLDHPNIIKVYEFYQDDQFFYIVQDLCTGGELFDKIVQDGFFSEKKAAQTMKQILSALQHCHNQKIVHRDLKPENLLYESAKQDAELKMIDFGTSQCFVPNSKLNKRIGTPYYIAPEVLNRNYDEKCDIWSSGVILYILLCGYPPFNGNTDSEIMAKIQKGQYELDPSEWDNISQEAKDLISHLLKSDPAERYNATEALNDPWIQKYNNPSEQEIPLMEKALTNMKNFSIQKKLQNAIFKFIVQELVTNEEKEQLVKTFQALDTNNDGTLSKEELMVGYNKIMKPLDAENEVNQIFQIVDKNNSGAIDYSEFIMATVDRKNLLSKQKLKEAFQLFDKDGNGKVSIDELKQVFSGISEEVWVQVIQEFDTNSDGQLSFEEFCQMMQNIQK